MLAISISLHILSVIIWVGGMFFAHMALRPVATRLLEPPMRITLLSQIFARFFPWVWIAIILLWTTGGWFIFSYYGGMDRVGLHIHVMLTLGLIMTLFFTYIFFFPFSALKRAVANKNFSEAGKHLNRIRWIIATNLALGLITTVVASAGQYF